MPDSVRPENSSAARDADSLSGQDTQGIADVPGAASAHPPATAVPAALANHPRYEMLELLGQGGMGAVYKARHIKMDRLVALKVINPKRLDNSTAVERFHREVKAAAKLDHPNIVRAHDADQAGGTHFLVMEFVEGTDLAKYVKKKGPLPVAHACHFIRQAAFGLQHAHERGMVHRDIKPHNLMLTKASPVASAAGAPIVKVMDFGLARLAHEGAAEAGLTGDNVLMGTADYIAPEQAEDAHKADIRADIYSLGCSLFHLLAGQPPFEGGTVVQKIAGHLSKAVPVADLPAAVPSELRTVLAKMVEKDPAKRYQTPLEVARALAVFVKQRTTAPRPSGSGGKQNPLAAFVGMSDPRSATVRERAVARSKRTRQRRWPMPVLIGVGVVALLLVATGIYLSSGERQRPEQRVEQPPGANASGSPEELSRTFANGLGMEFVLVRKGTFLMGGGDGTVGDKEVEIPHDFYLGSHEVTQEEWTSVMDGNPSYFSEAGEGRDEVVNINAQDLKRFPVEQVSWDDARRFLRALNAREKEAGWIYRLPTEAEWEYACRGGPTSNRFDYAFDFYFDEPAKELLPEQANFAHDKGLKRTCEVGSYKPNRLGLYDMHGNAWEWCDDEEKGADGASRRVCRGGSWYTDSGDCAAANRDANPPSDHNCHLGLRVARVPLGR